MATKTKRPKRAKTGPKPMPKHRKRSKVLSVRLTEAQLRAVRAAAREDEMTVANWTVDRILFGIKIPS